MTNDSFRKLPHNTPPPTQTLGIEFILNIRIGLEQMKDPSADILATKAKLDSIILAFANGINQGPTLNG